MALTTQKSADNNTLTIAISGRFDFNMYQDFRDAYEGGIANNAAFVLDFSSTEYIDSSALGMLLVLREQSGGDRANITIVNCNDEIKKILTISNFDKLFSID